MSQPTNLGSPFLSTSEFFSTDPSQLLIQLTSNHTNVANSLNIREIAQYEQGAAVLTGQQFSTIGSQQKKYTYRNLYYFGAIPSGGQLIIPHGLVGVTQYTKIYGTSLDAAGFYKPIPAAATGVNSANYQIDIYVNNTNIYINNGGAGIASAITNGLVVLEYLLN